MEKTMDASASITIDRPIDEVFSFISDVRNMSRWVVGVTEAHMTSDEVDVGATFACKYRYGWRDSDLELRVTAYEPPHVWATEAVRGYFSFKGRINLAADGSATRITNTIEAGPDSLATQVLFALGGPLIRRSTGKRLVRELERLATAISVEGSPAQG